MKVKRFVILLFSCLLVAGSLNIPAGAAVTYGSNVESAVTRATGQFEVTIPANTVVYLGDGIPLAKGETVTYNCTYTPKSVDVKFGVIDQDGYFYGLSGSNGSINRGLRVSEPGSYTLAVLNGSDEAVTVEGTVNY